MLGFAEEDDSNAAHTSEPAVSAMRMNDAFMVGLILVTEVGLSDQFGGGFVIGSTLSTVAAAFMAMASSPSGLQGTWPGLEENFPGIP